jgi:hypothetical protein
VCGGRIVGEGTPQHPVALMGAIRWDCGGVEAIFEELLLHHKFLRRSCVEKSKPGKKNLVNHRDWRVWSRPQGEQLKAQIAIGVD